MNVENGDAKRSYTQDRFLVHGGNLIPETKARR